MCPSASLHKPFDIPFHCFKQSSASNMSATFSPTPEKQILLIGLWFVFGVFFLLLTYFMCVMLYSISWCLTTEESLQQAFKLCINRKVGLYRKKVCVSAQRQIFAIDFTKLKLFCGYGFFWGVWFCLRLFGLVGCWFFWLVVRRSSARWAPSAPETENPFQTVYVEGTVYRCFFRKMHIFLLSHTIPILPCCFFCFIRMTWLDSKYVSYLRGWRIPGSKVL